MRSDSTLKKDRDCMANIRMYSENGLRELPEYVVMDGYPGGIKRNIDASRRANGQQLPKA